MTEDNCILADHLRQSNKCQININEYYELTGTNTCSLSGCKKTCENIYKMKIEKLCGV